ncbi:MAG: glucosaminidase domain-containing protein [Firmicutes bacterium]|nr:glucosaminidase domain-containing protein [Bacillota bacterium]
MRRKKMVGIALMLLALAAWAILQAAIQGVEVEQVRKFSHPQEEQVVLRSWAEAERLERHLAESEARLQAVASRIDAYLARWGSPLAGCGRVFAEEGERTGVNPHLPVAIAGAESTFGLACFAPHNAWGMLSYPQGFASWEEGIRANFAWLAKHYGRPQSAYDCPGYCVPDHPWMERVQSIIRELEESR